MSVLTKWLKRSKYHDAMFFWVHSLKVNLPAITIEGAIRNFVKHNGFIADDVDKTIQSLDDKQVHTMAQEYNRWIKELYGHQKTA